VAIIPRINKNRPHRLFVGGAFLLFDWNKIPPDEDGLVTEGRDSGEDGGSVLF
jgi:hypothetical protein